MKKIGRWIRRLLVVLSVAFLTLQPVLVPTVYAVESWSGNPWSGDSWSGDPWDGSDLQWEGSPWSGDPWSKEGSDADIGWEGYDWESQPWYLEGWSKEGFQGESGSGNPWTQPGFQGESGSGNPWTQPGFQGESGSGNPWTQPGFQGESGSGNPWTQPGFQGEGGSGNAWNQPGFQGEGGSGNAWNQPGFQGEGGLGYAWQYPGFSGNPYSADPGSGTYTPPDRFYSSDGYKGTKFVIDTVINGTANFVNDGLDGGFSHDKTSLHLTNLFVSGAKLHLGDSQFFDVYDMGKTGKTGFDKVKQLETLRQGSYALSSALQTSGDGIRKASNVSNISKTTEFAAKTKQYVSMIKDSASQVYKSTDISKVAGTWSNMGALSKFNFVTSGINAGVSAYKTGASVGDAIQTFNSNASGADKTAAVANIGSNLGETIMSAGGVAAAIPGGQALGAGLVAAGAGIFVVSKGVSLIARNWQGDVKSTAKEIGKKAGQTIKKGWKTVKGWFS
ncbi:hypothetical protein QGM71_15740 [Virgibacillus sp. C22-A2]|uniref:Uncharacterized protein n=1 Tax=Virgibacillus tibetensis TaxID=3042313 RepID=A0ABU6KKK7_9BACI|nr:hypothetical protein [Virgibacillus sp. C22-A2]